MCGYEYTSKLQRMFSDMALSKDLVSAFKEYTKKSDISLGGAVAAGRPGPQCTR